MSAETSAGTVGSGSSRPVPCAACRTTMPRTTRCAPETTAITAGRCSGGTSLAPALWASSTWESESLDDAHRRATSVRHGNFYSRYANPTVRSFERGDRRTRRGRGRRWPSPRAWERSPRRCSRCVRAAATSSPSASCTPARWRSCRARASGSGSTSRYVDVAEPGAFAAAVQPGRTMLVLAETPSNPRLELADLDELGSIKGPFTVVDSTFATPLGQQPLAHGVDISLHSATKGIAGHNDATLGVISGEADLLGEIWAYSVLHGATPSPFDALNALRGIRTLGVRTRQQNETARSLAVTLADHPDGDGGPLPRAERASAARPRHETTTAVRHRPVVRGGRSGCRGALPRCDPDRPGRHVARRTGDDRVPPRHVDARQPDARRTGRTTGVTAGLLRVSVGLEDGGDIVADFERALSAG